MDGDSEARPHYPCGAVFTPYDAIGAFLQVHQRCGEMDNGVEAGRVWMTCECGAGLAFVTTTPREGRRHSGKSTD